MNDSRDGMDGGVRSKDLLSLQTSTSSNPMWKEISSSGGYLQAEHGVMLSNESA